ncbi:MAG: transketolase [Actinobacteria bacterium]|nr:transketolase [Actinomycetota bacterium]
MEEQDIRPDAVVHTHPSPPHRNAAGDPDQLVVNTIRTLAIDAVEAAGSGHPGTPMALAPVAYALWSRFLKHDPSDPGWSDRDRFVLSAGHASMLLYAMLHLSGYDLPLDELKRFRQWGSRCPGHPERGVTPGVEVTTGPLGQGFANAVGLSIAERMLAARFNRPGHDVVDHYTHAICSDGDLMEGISAEAASLAGSLHLGKLVVLYDDNHITIEGSTELAFCEQVGKRFEAYGWQVLKITDANDLSEVSLAIEEGRAEPSRPSLIIVQSVIGFGAPTKQGTAAAHGSPLGAEEARGAKQNLGWPYTEPFTVPEEIEAFRRSSLDAGRTRHADWEERFAAYEKGFPDLAAEFRRTISGELPADWGRSLPSFEVGTQVATRSASGKVLNAIASEVPELVGGSADLAPSTDTYLEGFADVSCGDFSGRNFHFGVREHAMGSMMNGIIAHGGLRPYGGTFFVFSDYMRPSIRMAALMGLPVVFVFTHDSIGLGEDGPTHQPVEHLAALRAIPNLLVIRPADANETAQAWRVALDRRESPTALILTRQKLPVLPEPLDDAVSRGAYVIADGKDVVLVATGSEVHLALSARRLLADGGVSARVVSMPCWELFESQLSAYRDQVLPPGVPRLGVEAARSFGWCTWVDDVVSLDRFGASAPAETLFGEFGFTPENVAQRARRLLADRGGS